MGTPDASSWVPVESREHPDRVFYYNTDSRASRWTQPTPTSDPNTVRAYHVLVKHCDSRNPVTRGDHLPVTRTRQEALEKAQQIHTELLGRASKENHDFVAVDKKDFESVAKRESDCSSGVRGGDLGSFGRKAMQPAFERAAFALAVGEVSGVIETNSGFHVVLRLK